MTAKSVEAMREEIGDFLSRVMQLAVVAFPERLEKDILIVIAGNQQAGVEIQVCGPQGDDWATRANTIRILGSAMKYVARAAPADRRAEVLGIMRDALSDHPRSVDA